MKKILIFLIVMLCFQVTHSATGDCTLFYWIRNSEATYDATRNDASGSNDSSSGGKIGQATGFNVHRGYLHFDIPALANCTSAYLYLNGETDNSTTDFELMAYEGEWAGNPSNAEWDEFDGHEASGAYSGTTWIDIGEWSTSSFVVGWNVIEINAAGCAKIFAAQGSELKFVLISKEDTDESAPANNEYVDFYPFNDANEPYLRINDPIGAGYTGTACGLDNPAGVCGIAKANLKNFCGVE